jgi:16S rRNA (cytosine967-C5)-methyltransferase
MSDSVTLNRAASIIDQVTPELPADSALREALSGNHELSAAEKRAAARAVFVYYRWWQWLEAGGTTQQRLAAALALQARYDADESSIKPEALAARAVPAWVASEIDPVPPGWLQQLQRDPALWIRIQREFAASVPRALGNCTPADLSAYLATAPSPATAYRFGGFNDLFRTDEFHKGLFEIQDLASQLVGLACAPQPGETWWDTCAGEGGKTLHLADLMENKGVIWASDRSARRLAALKKRAGRAKVFNYRAVNWNGGPFLPTKTKFDGILIDAPCSGVGTWQRNPHARWSTTLEDVRELADLQAQLLNHVAGSLKPGGRLIYSVCTVTRSETTAVAEAFAATHPELEPLAVLGGAPQRFIWPQDVNANGMFIAAWKRKA